MTYKSTIEKSSLDRRFPITLFPSEAASEKRERRESLRRIAKVIERQTAPSKSALPFIKLATFGDDKSRRECLRTNANVREISGVELDYDSGEIAAKTAAAKLEKAGITALIFTTPSNGQPGKGFRWRVLAPTSKPHRPPERARFVATLNGLFDGAFAEESFTLSQAFYFGRAEGGASIETHLIEGRRYVDEVSDIEPRWKDARTPSDGDGDTPRQYFDGDMKRLQSALNAIEPSERYWPWLHTGMAIHHETDGSPEGFDIWLQHAGHDDGNMADKWDSFGRSKGARKTGAWLAEVATEQGWTDPIINKWFEVLGPADDREAKPGTLKFYSPADLSALPELYDFVEDTLFEGQLSEWFGDPKIGKTFAVLDLAMREALGLEWHGKAVERGCVVYIALEGLAGIRRRIRAWCQYHDVDQNSVPILVAGGALNLRSSKRERAQLVEQAKRMAEKFGIPVRLLIVDTLHRSLGGGSDSKEEDMSALIAGVDALRRETGAHVLLIHHSGLSDKDRGRGHSSLFGAIDTRVKVYDVPKREGLKALKITAQKEGEDGAIFPFILRTVDLGYVSKRGKPVTSAVATPEIVPDEFFDDLDAEDSPDERTKAALAIRDALEDKSDAAWRAALKAAEWPYEGCKPVTFRQLWKRLKQERDKRDVTSVTVSRHAPQQGVTEQRDVTHPLGVSRLSRLGRHGEGG